MNENPLHNEKLDIRIEVAKPEQWEMLKRIRLKALASKDAKMFGKGLTESDKEKTDEDWKAELSAEVNKIRFYILAIAGSEAEGMLRAQARENGIWSVNSAYLEEEFRGKVSPRKVFNLLVEETKKRGGSKIRLGVRTINNRSLRLYELLGFNQLPISLKEKIFNPISSIKWRYMEFVIDDSEEE